LIYRPLIVDRSKEISQLFRIRACYWLLSNKRAWCVGAGTVTLECFLLFGCYNSCSQFIIFSLAWKLFYFQIVKIFSCIFLLHFFVLSMLSLPPPKTITFSLITAFCNFDLLLYLTVQIGQWPSYNFILI
jgi:hypothetical protein